MKPQMNQKKPLQARNRDISRPTNASGVYDQAKPAAPRMLRRTTRQSFMDVDLQDLLRYDPTILNPFQNSSSLLSDPPSLFRPLPPVAAAAQAIAQGAGPWTFHEAARLQKEQEDLRVQYLQFLHQLHLTNPHGFLAHMNTFATEYPQEFLQLQSYIQFQEQQAAQQREEQRKHAELAQCQMELEKRQKAEQDLRQFQHFQEMQHQRKEQEKQQELLGEWLVRRQQTRASHRKELDLADLFTLAFQRDHQLVSKVASSPGGMDMLLTPQQQFEFGQFLQAHHVQEEETKRKEALMSAFGLQITGTSAPGATGVFGGLSSPVFGMTSKFDAPASNTLNIDLRRSDRLNGRPTIKYY